MRWLYTVCFVSGMERFHLLFGWRDEIILVIVLLTTICGALQSVTHDLLPLRPRSSSLCLPNLRPSRRGLRPPLLPSFRRRLCPPHATPTALPRRRSTSLPCPWRPVPLPVLASSSMNWQQPANNRSRGRRRPVICRSGVHRRPAS